MCCPETVPEVRFPDHCNLSAPKGFYRTARSMLWDAGLDLLLFGTCHPILIKKQTNIYIYIHIKHSTINHGFTYRIYTSPPSFRHGPSSSQVSWLCRWWKWPQPGLAPEPLSVWAKRWRAMEELSLWWFRLENGLRNGLRTGKSVF